MFRTIANKLVALSPAILLLAVGRPADAGVTYYVAPCGDDAWSGTASACAAPNGPKRTIQAAIDATVDGDTVLVADGTYTGPGNRDLDFAGRLITIRGGAATVIDCQGTAVDPHRAFRFHSGETAESVIDTLTIRNGFMDFGGAMVCEDGSSPSVIRCTFELNTAHATTSGGEGGAVRSVASSPRFTSCRFVRNTAERIAGVGGRGGAIQYLLASSPALIDCRFEENTAASGGGVEARDNVSATLINCTFIRNSTTDPAFNGGGGYLASLGGHSLLTNCVFSENYTARQGGAVWILRGATAEITGCTFTANHADDGSCTTATGDARITLTNCIFSENTSYVGPSALVAFNGFFGPSVVTAANCTFSGNVGLDGEYALGVGDTSSLVVTNSIVWGNAPGAIDGGPLATVTFSNIQGGWPGIGNKDADPRFADPTASDFRLSVLSPCIDAGNSFADVDAFTPGVQPLPATDLEGLARRVDIAAVDDTGIGAPVVDMGAYEFRCPADYTADGLIDFADYLEFLNLFDAQDPRADLNQDGLVDFADYLDFLNHFDAGC